MRYIVVKEFEDGTFTTEFFHDLDSAKEYAKQQRSLKGGIIKSVTVYEATDD